MEEATTFKLTSLLDSLPSCENKLTTVDEINIVLCNVPPTTLKRVVPNLSFSNLFECFSITISPEHLEICCSVLSKLLDAVDEASLLSNFHQELLVGLNYSNEAICNLCLSQILRIVECSGSENQLSLYTDILQKVAALVGCDALSSSKLASKIIVKLGKTRVGLQLLLCQPEVLSCIEDVLKQGDEVRFRMYECLAEISANSIDGMQIVNQCGLLPKFLGELDTDDVLTRLNCLELLSTIAVTAHGRLFLQQQGIMQKLDTVIGNVECDPFGGLLLPGLMKLFGSICSSQPLMTLTQHRNFASCLFDAIRNGPPNDSVTGIAVETIGFIGKHPDGKLALKREGGMPYACRRLGMLMCDAPTELRVRVIDALSQLMDLQPSDQTSELLSLTEDWFGYLSSTATTAVASIVAIAQQPFIELHLAALHLLSSLVVLPWCQQLLVDHAGFLEYLLDRSTERGERPSLEAKYEVITRFASSSTVTDVVSAEYLIRLREYVREGPFYVKHEAQVTFESAE